MTNVCNLWKNNSKVLTLLISHTMRLIQNFRKTSITIVDLQTTGTYLARPLSIHCRKDVEYR